MHFLPVKISKIKVSHNSKRSEQDYSHLPDLLHLYQTISLLLNSPQSMS